MVLFLFGIALFLLPALFEGKEKKKAGKKDEKGLHGLAARRGHLDAAPARASRIANQLRRNGSFRERRITVLHYITLRV